MSRPREFDIETAVDDAVEVLWTKGYGAASLDDLCEATGLSRSSFYSAFGDKRQLLLRALDHYLDRRAMFLAQRLSRPTIHTALKSLWKKTIDDIVIGPGRRGCFIGNCAVEISRQDKEAVERVSAALSRNQAIFRDALAAAQTRGELPRHADVEAMARFLNSSIQGLQLVGKANPDRPTLEDIGRVTLRCLD